MIIGPVHLRCDCPQICWCPILQSKETACARFEAGLRSVFRPRPFIYQILSVYPGSANIAQALGIIIAFERNDLPEVIEDILGMEEGELKLVLHGLSSLMDENRSLLECHPSLCTCFIL